MSLTERLTRLRRVHEVPIFRLARRLREAQDTAWGSAPVALTNNNGLTRYLLDSRIPQRFRPVTLLILVARHHKQQIR